MSSLVLLDPWALDAGASLSFDDADGNCAGQCREKLAVRLRREKCNRCRQVCFINIQLR